MREIKFRGKVATTDEWVYGHYAFVDGYHVIYEKGSPYIIKLNTLGQYTGLKDKNGKEIYEKDILLFNNSINNRKWVCVVEFRAGGFVCEYPKDGMYNHFDSWNVPKVTWEIIGNAFQNPELLEL